MSTTDQNAAPAAKRRYDSALRREQVARTRERIVDAAVELGRELSSWDWRGVTIANVAARAGVHERTVFRHVGTEAGLRHEVAERLERDAGTLTDGLQLQATPDVVRSLYAFLADVPGVTKHDRVDPALAAVDARRRDSVRNAVAAAGPELSPQEQAQVAAVLDVLASPATFRRLTLAWNLGADSAADASAWVVGLVVEAVADGRRPGSGTRSVSAG